MKIIILIFLVLLQIKCNSEVSSQIEFNKVARCVACRFIWENIEEALGGQSVNPILAAEAF